MSRLNYSNNRCDQVVGAGEFGKLISFKDYKLKKISFQNDQNNTFDELSWLLSDKSTFVLCLEALLFLAQDLLKKIIK